MVLVCLLTVFFSLSLLSHFSPCAVWGWGWLGASQKIALLMCMQCLGLWLKGVRGGGQSIQCVAIFYYMCGVAEVEEGGNTIAKLPKYD